MKNFRFLFVIIAIVIIAVGAIFWLIKTNKYKSLKISKGTIKNIVAASGSLKAEKKANLSFNKVGRISYLPVKENQEVKKWQVVASLDRSDLIAVKNKELKDYLVSRWDFEQRRDDYNISGNYRNETLTDEEKRLLEKDQFSLDRSVLDVETADRGIKNASLIAPFKGVVIEVNGEINEWTSAFSSKPLVKIVDFSTLYFEAEVDQEYAGKIKIGQKAIVKLDAYPKKEFKAEVYDKEKQVKKTEEGDKIVAVKIKLSNLPSDITLGLEGDAEIILEEKQALIIPKQAVEIKKGKTYVKYKKSWLDFKEKEIELGTFDGKNYEVLSGIIEGDNVWFQ